MCGFFGRLDLQLGPNRRKSSWSKGMRAQPPNSLSPAAILIDQCRRRFVSAHAHFGERGQMDAEITL
jgi:hypothetical protein